MIRKSTFDGSNFTIWLPDQAIHQIFIYDEKQSDLPIGWAMLMADDKKECSILYIQIRSRYRNMGYGKKIIKMLQNAYDHIITDYEPTLVEDPSTKLLESCGFKIVPSVHKNVPGKIEWRKECVQNSKEVC